MGYALDVQTQTRSVEGNRKEHRLVLFRHGQTEWSTTGQHTGRTDLDLTATGEQEAEVAAAVIGSLRLDRPVVISSPRRRATATAKLAGLSVDETSEQLAEWDYGAYEGLTTPQIRESEPDWLVWTHGCVDGESVGQVSDRADSAVAMALDRMTSHDVVFVGHNHFLRAVIARWLELPLTAGLRFAMPSASIAVCRFEHAVGNLGALGLTGR